MEMRSPVGAAARCDLLLFRAFTFHQQLHASTLINLYGNLAAPDEAVPMANPYRELFKLFRQSGYNRATMIEVGKTFPDEASTIEFLHTYKGLWTELASA